jgi:hypothetical protein
MGHSMNDNDRELQAGRCAMILGPSCVEEPSGIPTALTP